MRASRLVLAAIAALLVIAPAAPAQEPELEAQIRRTEYGIPHIKADDYAGLGYGFGYAFAKDNICTIADDYVTVRAERSRWFGPDGTYTQGGNGVSSSNLNSDFFWQQVRDSGIVDGLMGRKPPMGPQPELLELLRGYVAGYNRYLEDVGGPGGITDPRCKGEPWVRPIDEETASLRFYQLALLASSGFAMNGIVEAQPPTGLPVASTGVSATRLADALEDFRANAIGSNAVAIGRDGSRNGNGLLLGNPHFPWSGTERFYQFQFTIPGELDVSGATLFGVPLVLIGHTRNMAWSHTVSTAYRFTPFQLTLAPGDPTSYLVDGKPVRMSRRAVTVEVRQDDGSLEEVSRTLYSTKYGPVLTELAGIPLPWTHATAFAMGDANAENVRVFNHFLETNRAQSAEEMLEILRKYQGIPWVNTIVADRSGDALYADIGAVPNVDDNHARRCNTALGHALTAYVGLPVLDGSRSECGWPHDSDATAPGLLPRSKQPYLFRDDYVTNSNDSYWLSNPHEPLEGFPRIMGDERTARSLRTRIGLVMTGQRVTGEDGLGPAGFTRQDMQDMVFSNRVHSAELARDAAVQMCDQQALIGWAPTSSGVPVEVGGACDALREWDMRENVDSKGAVLWRRFWDRVRGAQGSPWLRLFDTSDPVRTPNTLNTAHPIVRTALGDAIADLRAAGVELDAELGSAQFVSRDGEDIPIHGGPGGNGNFNAIYPDWSNSREGRGLGEPSSGSSFVQVVTWDDSRCPDAATILSYSQSENAESPHHSDQTRLYSRKQWVEGRFCEHEIATSPALERKTLSD